MKRKNIVCITMVLMGFMLMSFSALAQNQGKIWYFGIYGGLNFNTNPPTPLPGGQLNTIEGCATICDGSGNLLFYTDGMSVWNRNHTVMPNGTGLMGHPSSAQSGIIVPDPGDSNKYYVFEVSAYEVGSHAYYSKVDMTLNGGLGDVETIGKNSILLLGTEEGIAAVPSSDATFWWVIVHKRPTSNFYAFRLTSAGIDTGSPVISTVGTATPATGVIGQIKSNAAGNRLAMTTFYGHYAEVYDFNNATGVISNPIRLNHHWSYSAEFSPNGNLLYVSSLNSAIYQYNLLAGSEAQINSTRYAFGYNGAALQSAPDGKIYCASRPSTSLGVISNPNTIGVGCGYAPNAQPIAGTCQWGLPNIIASYVSTGPPQLDSLAHSGVTGTGATLSANVTTDGGEPITARGFYYGTSPNPTGNQTLVAGTTGPMSADISGLTPETTYYYRAFATNSNGTNSIGDGTFTTISTNQPPEAICKDIQIAADNNCEAYITAADVDGGSYDPDEGDEITLSLNNSGPFGIGAHYVELTVTDQEGESDSCFAQVTVVDNLAPVPDAATLPTITGQCSATITTYPTATDNCAGIITGTTTDPLTYNQQGTYTVTWTYNDGNGNIAVQEQTVIVQDTTAPTMTSIAASPNTLWPPNHKMVAVTIGVDAADNCDASPVSKIIAVTSNEPINGLGDGDTGPDWEITGDLTLNLRAERSGKGNGRIYTITVQCSDAVGKTTTGTVTVLVPKNKKKK